MNHMHKTNIILTVAIDFSLCFVLTSQTLVSGEPLGFNV